MTNQPWPPPAPGAGRQPWGQPAAPGWPSAGSAPISQTWGRVPVQYGSYPPPGAFPAPHSYAPPGAFPPPGGFLPPGGFPPPGTFPPPGRQPRRGGLRSALLGLVAVIALGFFVLSLVDYLNSDESAAVTPSVSRTSAPPVNIPRPDFDPSELPAPATLDEAKEWLTDNAFYAESVAPETDCTLGRIAVVGADSDELADHLNALTGCLMMVWQEPVERAGFELPRPPVTVYDQPVTSACGELDTHNAVYCSADQRVYFATDLYEVFGNDPEVAHTEFLIDLVIGHEFAHALQGRTGILVSNIALEQNASDSEGLWLSRRAEQQADCWSGVFLNSVAQAWQMTDDEREGLARLANAIGDDSLSGGTDDGFGNHGLGASRERWFRAGLGSNQVGTCNTWVVPKRQVR